MASLLSGEVAEWSKALDWNSSYIFTGVRGFESHPLRQNNDKPGLAPGFVLLHLERTHRFQRQRFQRLEIVLHFILRDIDLEPHGIDAGRGRAVVHRADCHSRTIDPADSSAPLHRWPKSRRQPQPG